VAFSALLHPTWRLLQPEWHQEHPHALQGRCPGQCYRSYATVANLIFKDFARPAENCRCARFADSDLDTSNLRIVQAFEQQQMTTVVYNDNYNRGFAFCCLRFCRCSDLLCGVKRSTFFMGNSGFAAVASDNNKVNVSRVIGLICAISRPRRHAPYISLHNSIGCA